MGYCRSIFLSPDHIIEDANELMAKYKISGVPITENGRLVGILTNRDLRFLTDYSQKIGDVMTKDNLVTAPVGTTLTQAKEILRKYRIEKLPLVDERLFKGLITIKDIEKLFNTRIPPRMMMEDFLQGCSRVTANMMERVEAL